MNNSVKRKESSHKVKWWINFLLVLMLCLVGLIVWLIVPMLARDSFGDPISYLSQSQRWNYSFTLLLHRNELFKPNCATSKNANVTIAQGDSIYSITGKLADAGLIQNQEAFRSYLIYKGIDTNILAGNYALSCALSPVAIADKIENHTLESVEFDILPGWRAEEIADALISSGIEVSPEEFLAAVNHPEELQLPEYLQNAKTVEGFLFPGKYTIQRNISADDLVQTFISRFDQEISTAGLLQKSSEGLDVYQKVILASIVQRESYAISERPMIASVFFNRLAMGMKLETDPTVQYALGFSERWGWWKSPLSANDLKIQSNYNTYIIAGLPPTPIDNPDVSAIEAVENPAKSNYLFFRAKCDKSGTHLFAKTLEEQIANACK